MTRALFRYRALDANGGEFAGAIEADSEADAFAKLSAKDLAPYELGLHRAPTPVRWRKTGPTQAELGRYLRQLATLLSANVTVLEALTTLGRGRADPLIAVRNQTILADLRSGKRLSAALETHLPELPDYVFRLADLGEATGSLSKSLTDAADRMDYEQQVRADIRAALTYPMFLLAIGGAIVALMFAFVVPRFATLLGDNLSNAPWLSRVVIGAGLWMRDYWPATLGLLALAIGSVVLAWRRPGVRAAVDAALEKAPVIGPFLRISDLSGWCRTVGIAVLNKAQLVDALRLGESGARSTLFRQQLARARSLVRAGKPLEEALLEADPAFEPMVLDLIRTGRNSGALGEMLTFSAGIYEKEAREKTRQITSLAEPLAIVGISLVVAAIVIAIVLAMTSIYDFEF